MSILTKIFNFIWSKQFLINLLLIVVFYIAGYFFLESGLKSKTRFGQQIEVPNLIGKNQNVLNGLSKEHNLKFVVLDSIYDPKKIPGTILEQDPKPTSDSEVFVKENRTISVRVSKNIKLVEVGSFISKSQRFAEKMLDNSGFRYVVEYKASKEDDGAVLDQIYKGKTIEKGARIPIGSKIKLIVGRNEQGVPVPMLDLTGLTVLEAKNRLKLSGSFNVWVNYINCNSTNDSLTARVISQNPMFEPEGVVLTGSTITISAQND